MPKIANPNKYGYCRQSGRYVLKRDHDRECKEKCDIVSSKTEVDGRCHDSGGCFISTAVCMVHGMPDDCDLLNTLRNFRDTYMMETQERKELVQLYYQIAPDILIKINRQQNNEILYRQIMKRYILPAYQQIKKGNKKKALNIYKRAVIFAKEMAT